MGNLTEWILDAENSTKTITNSCECVLTQNTLDVLKFLLIIAAIFLLLVLLYYEDDVVRSFVQLPAVCSSFRVTRGCDIF